MSTPAKVIPLHKPLTTHAKVRIRNQVWDALRWFSSMPWSVPYLQPESNGTIEWPFTLNGVTVVAVIQDPNKIEQKYPIPEDMERMCEMTSSLHLRLYKRKTLYQWTEFLKVFPQHGLIVQMLFRELEIMFMGAAMGQQHEHKNPSKPEPDSPS